MFGFIALWTLNYLAFLSFDCQRTWWKLFQKRVLSTIFDIYVFNRIAKSEINGQKGDHFQIYQSCQDNMEPVFTETHNIYICRLHTLTYTSKLTEERLRTKLYDKREVFNFPIVNFPFICCNIPAAPAYEVYISQLIRYSRACGSYQDFLDRGLLLAKKLLKQGFLLVKLKSSLRKFYGRPGF